MAFDLENAVQQGFNRDVTTNDWHVEARNLEIKLDDHGGVREFRILDNENVGVLVADSDGYLSIAGNAEVHGGHVLVRGEGLTNSEYLTLQDETEEVSVHLFDLNPDGTISGEQGSFGTNYNDGYLYVNTDGSTKWERLAMVSQIPNLEGNIVAHSDLTGIGTDDHHTKYTDGEAVAAVGPHFSGDHGDLSNVTTDQHHAESHTIASHSDTSGTGPELDTLTDGSNADALHTHAGASSTTTLQQAYKNDIDDVAAIIHTDSADGYVEIAGDQKFMVSAAGGFDLDTGFDMDGAGPFDVDITGAVSIDADVASNITVNGAGLTLSTTTAGDVQITVPDGGGDFVVEDANSSQYIKTNTGNGELVLGDNTTPVFVTVMNDMEVMGNFIVQGTTTTLNTQELFVEDRLVRLNTASPSNFTGNVGIEAEVGSDGYVEFHWDDTQGRWEIGIDRNTTPEAQTFRPLGYLAEDAATLDLSNTGDDGWPTAGPNATAGASVINTNLTNFPYTFGPDMTDDSVQAALEAIDGYFMELSELVENVDNNVTLQVAYDNDPDGGNVTLTTNVGEGDLVIAGTETLNVTTAGGLDLDSGFDMDSTDSFDVDVTGSGFHLDAYGPGGDSNISVDTGDLVLGTTTSGIVHIDGADGITIDGNGNGLIPEDSCSEPLGDSTHGWSDVWVCVNGTPTSLIGDGSDDKHNSTSGAEIVGTNPLNFDTFGPDMADSTVQAALEAIDGYFGEIFGHIDNNADITFQEIYDNSCGDATIVLSEACGPITFEGAEQVIYNNTGGVEFNEEVVIQGNGPFVVDITGEVNISSESDINLTTTQIININGEGGVVIDGYELDITLQGNGQTIINNTGGLVVNNEFIMEGGGPFVVDITGEFNVSSESTVNITTTDVVNINGEGGIVLDGYGNNVIPGTSCTDELGDSTHGWLDLWVCKDGTPTSLIGAGTDSTANTTSGAAIVGTNPLNFEMFGGDMTDDSVQAALEAIDGYLSDIVSGEVEFDPFTQVKGLDINGCVLNGVGKVWTSAGTPGLRFSSGGTSRASWSLPVPADWDGASDIVVEFVWAPSDAGVGDVSWRLEYKSLALTELASSASSNVDYAQAADGTADGIQTTNVELAIPAASIDASDEIMVVNAVRRGSAAADTYSGKAYVYLVKYSYTAKNIV